ncbi:YlbL family protein [Corynebacterium uterequi]|uniref:endopeptidase La n=1 Tax=Corynebacterium uterequi TaxID=1072256 RepID=A0A0G3HF08_9CORY|nr:PDZ domain-containing protein [Corynebacterium uterequi]AKK10553.1 putative secreted protein containing a PDZ domain [Corynebacterium uterequi]
MSSPDTVAESSRWSTIAWGTIPVALLLALAFLPRIPFTDVSLAVPFAAQGPGPVFDTLGEVDGEPVVEITGTRPDDTAGEMYMTTVAVRVDMSLAQAISRWLTTDDTLVPIGQVLPPNKTPEEVDAENKAAFAQSEAAANAAAMHYLNMPTQVYVVEPLPGTPAEGTFEPGDVVLAINGQRVDDPAMMRDLVVAQHPGDRLTVEFTRGSQHRRAEVVLGSSKEDADLAQLGVLLGVQPASGVSVSYNLQDVGGPSAGMMFSLALIDKLSPGELNHGLSVAGTGTIAEDGTVGPIGGIVHKVEAAERADVELFLAPTANCAEAVSRDPHGLTVAAVGTLDDAVDAMAAFADGREVRTCQQVLDARARR